MSNDSAAAPLHGIVLPRLHVCDPDYRSTPKTNRFCWHCQRDLKQGSGFIVFVLLDDMALVHPDDAISLNAIECLMGPECIRKQRIPNDFVVRQ